MGNLAGHELSRGGVLQAPVDTFLKPQEVSVVDASNKCVLVHVDTVIDTQLPLDVLKEEGVKVLPEIRLTAEVNVEKDGISHLLSGSDKDQVPNEGGLADAYISNDYNRSAPQGLRNNLSG
jgi:hypothetical protein